MRWWMRFIRKARANRQLDSELRFHLEQQVSEYVASGLSPDEARRRARLEFGGLDQIKERVHAAYRGYFLETLLQDIRYGFHMLRKSPGFTAVAIITLALGIGATTAIFSVVEGVLLKPLPYPNAGRIVALRHTAPGIQIDDMGLAASLYFTYTDESRVFQDVGMWLPDSWTVTGLGEPEQVRGISVTHRFLDVLGIHPIFGRSFTVADENPQGERTVMLSDGYWRSHFGADRSVLGRHILLDGNGYTVIGVLPPSFEFMDQKISLVAPLRFRRSEVNLVSFCCQGIARLKPGVTLAEANTDVARMLALAPLKFPVNPGFSANIWSTARFGPRLRYLKDFLVSNVGQSLWPIFGTVGIVLLIACANVANLLLVRADGRHRELAIRAALGAGWGRIARELLLESLLLGVVGGALGLALAYGALRGLSASGLEHLPRARDIQIDPVVILFTAGTSLGSSLLLGFIPAFKYARPRLWKALGSNSRTLTDSHERHRARGLLVVVQVALAVVLLVGSGLMIRSFRALRDVDPGFTGASTIETMRTGIPDSQVKDPEGVVRMEEAILTNLRAIPGVTAAAIIDSLPMGGGSNDPVYAEDHAAVAGSVPPIRRYKYISPGYFAAVGARLIAGRDITWTETYNQAPVALVSENVAREMWGDPRAALGKRIRPTLKDDWRTVIGVVGDLHDDGLDRKAPGIVYWPLLQKNFESQATVVTRSAAFVLRTPRAGKASLVSDMRSAVEKVDSSLPLWDADTLQSLYDASLERTSFTMLLLAIAGGMAMFLALIGLYGVLSYSVAQRTNEIGIRMALGAQPGAVMRFILRQGTRLAAAGIAIGAVATLGLSRFLSSMLFGVRPNDPPTLICVVILLLAIAVFACYIPARRAMKVDPMVALRHE